MGLFSSVTKIAKKATSIATKAAITYAKVQSGAGLAQLAYENLGKSTQFKDLASFNKIDIFKPLTQGQNIRIPSGDDLKELAISLGKEQATKAIKNIESDLIGLAEQRVNPCLSGELSDEIGKISSSIIDWIY